MDSSDLPNASSSTDEDQPQNSSKKKPTHRAGRGHHRSKNDTTTTSTETTSTATTTTTTNTEDQEEELLQSPESSSSEPQPKPQPQPQPQPPEKSLELVHQKEEYDFGRDVRHAFLLVSAQILGCLFLFLLYYNYLMIKDQMIPLFWACLFSVFLRLPQAYLMGYTEGIKQVEEEKDENGQEKSFLKKFRAKLQFVWTQLFLKPIALLLGIAFLSNILCILTGWGCWVPWFWITIIVLLFLAAVSFTISYTNSSSLNGLWTTLVVTGFLFVVILSSFLFAYKIGNEFATFVVDVQDFTQRISNDPYWHDIAQKNGISPETVGYAVNSTRNHIEDWALSQGYNLTQIGEGVTQAKTMMDKILEEAEGELNFRKIFERNLDSGHLMEQIKSLDFEFIKEKAHEVFGYLFETVSVATSIGQTISGLIDSALSILVFVGALFFFIQSESNIFELVFQLFPISQRQTKVVVSQIEESISQIFVCSFLLALARGVITWLYFTIMGLNFAYFAGVLTALTTIFPLISPHMLFVPTLAIKYYLGATIWPFILMIFIGEMILGQLIEPTIQDMIPNSNPFLMGLALVLGVSTFGIEGLMIGPMLIILATALYNIFSYQLSQEKIIARNGSP